MSAEATAWVWANSPYAGPQLLAHLAVADVVNASHGYEFWMSTYALAEKARVGRSTIVRWLADAVESGYLEVVKPGQGTRCPTTYRLAINRPTQSLARPTENLARTTQSLTRPTEAPSLGPHRATELELNPSNANKRAPARKLKADPECVTCRGEGQYRSPITPGQIATCSCTYRDELDRYFARAAGEE